MASSSGKVGTSTSSISYTTAGLSGIERAKQRQEDRWERKAGKVESRILTPEELAERKPAKRVIVDSPFRRSKQHEGS